jgi:hypothetical protein
MTDWWLKVRRAEKHMVDIQQEAIRYASSHPYTLTRIRLPDSKNQIRYRFQITEQPNPMIAVMLGDFIHNLRTALDYIVVASVPKQRRKNAGFPILFQDIFATDKNGKFVVNDAELRERTEAAIYGLHPEARAFIIRLQPYQTCQFGFDVSAHNLGIIGRLENADKHRQLITIGYGVQDATVSFSIRDFPNERFQWREKSLGTGAQFLKDNKVIPFNNMNFDGLHHLDDGSPIKPSDVQMHLSGTAKILVKVPRIGGNQTPDNFLLDTIMPSALSDVRDILKYLETFVLST